MAKPISLNAKLTWKTRKAAKENFQIMLAKYKNGDTVDAEDRQDLAALLVHYDASVHPGEKTKAGVGIAYFMRKSNADIGWPSDSFHVFRTDGSSTDFSYIHAVNSSPIVES
ncbi:MAG: hypothetical protein JWQ10_4155 [Herbaspirillum sp.]|nr:hypothetical protein [Herbaspirillum sp.]